YCWVGGAGGAGWAGAAGQDPGASEGAAEAGEAERGTGAQGHRGTGALGRLGRIDVMVNNAAGNFYAPSAALTPNGWRAVVETDLFGPFSEARLSTQR
ncbi:MAG: hypothetical protein O7F70_10485, partial [Gemmatimonadetes bacterium]|nr:hypothetical protein [Gemmatimonadota bacterium]